MPKSLDANFDTWQLGEIVTSSKGVKSTSLTAYGQPIYVQLTSQCDPLSTPFGPARSTTSRRLGSILTSAVQKSCRASLHAWTAGWPRTWQTTRTGCSRGRCLIIDLAYINNGDYPATLRCKLNTVGQKACRFWTDKFERLNMPEDLRLCGLIPRVHVKSLYIMGREVGLVIDCTDLLVITPEETCPFADQPFE